MQSPFLQARAVDWSPKLNATGSIVEGVVDIDQAIRIILTTPKRSDPHRPEFGWGGFAYLDLPPGRALPHLVRETIEAIRLWERRVDVDAVQPEMIEGEHWQLVVNWTEKASGQAGTTTAPVS